MKKIVQLAATAMDNYKKSMDNYGTGKITVYENV